jgi:C4-dicarboxylate transporter, DctM subunit
MTTLLIVGLILIFFLGAPLFSVMLGATALGALILPRDFTAEFAGPLVTTYGMGTKDESIVFSTIPLFIYAGYIMAAGKTADRLVRFANAMLGWMPGGLAIVTIFACAVFTVFTGASGVTIIALGGVVMPALIKQKYPERFSLGLVAGTGSVGLLFPPALPLFIFGTVYGLNKELKDKWDWDTERFLGAGVVPGLVLLGCLSVVAVIAALIWKVPRQKFSASELGKSFVIAVPELILPFAIIGALVTGTASVPQVAGLTVVYLMVLSMGVYRDFKPVTLWRIGQESLALIGTIFLVIYTSSAFTNLLVTAEVPQDIVKWTTAHVGSKWVFLLVLNVVLLLVGTMMDIFSAVIVVLPLVAGIADYYGVNPYHLGVIFLLNLELGYIHPPVGINLFIASFKFQKPLLEVTKAVLPFLAAMFVALIIVTYVPQLTWVPPPKREGTISALQAIAQEGYMRASSVEEVPLPGGGTLKKVDCAKLEDDRDRGSCEGVFIDVTLCRRQGGDAAAACEREAIAGYVQVAGGGDVAAGIESLPLPGGATLNKSDCDKIADDLDKDTCHTLFTDVAECRLKTGELAKECETEALADYVEEMGPTGLGAEDE